MTAETPRVGRATRAATLSAEAIGIIGSGGFATALASVLASTERTAVIYTEDAEVRHNINRHHRNDTRLPGVSLAKRVAATGDVNEIASLCRVLILSVPSHRAHPAVEALAAAVTPEHTVAHAIGGLAAGDVRISELCRQLTPKVGALAGPALPRDITARRSCALVAAADDPGVLAELKRVLHIPPTLRIYLNRDIVGVELSAALSGAMTVAVGLADGLGVGHGPRTVLITRAAGEAARLSAACGAQPTTFFGMAGLGNLLVRTSPESREYSKDYQLGWALGRGEPIPEASTEGASTLAVFARIAAARRIDAPIITLIHRTVIGELTADLAADRLASWETDLEQPSLTPRERS